MSTASSNTPPETLAGLRVAFAGRLAGMSKREAQQLVRTHGGEPVDGLEAGANLLVLAEQSPPLVLTEVLGPDGQKLLEEGQLVALNETQFWQHLGLVEDDPNVSRMYTPAMLAELLGVPVAMVRRWHRSGFVARGVSSVICRILIFHNWPPRGSWPLWRRPRCPYGRSRNSLPRWPAGSQTPIGTRPKRR